MSGSSSASTERNRSLSFLGLVARVAKTLQIFSVHSCVQSVNGELTGSSAYMALPMERRSLRR